MRFGVLKPNHYADDAKELINITTVITDEDPDNPNLKEYFDFDKEDLKPIYPPGDYTGRSSWSSLYLRTKTAKSQWY